MTRTNRPAEDAQALNERMNAPEDRRQRRHAQEVEAAMRPASGAAIPQAYAGAAITAEGSSPDGSETADSVKRAAESDGRV